MQVIVATVGAPHGIRGAVTLRVRSDDPARRLYPGATIATCSPIFPQLTVATVSATARSLTIRFEQIESREEAEQLRGVDLIVEVDSQLEADAEEDAYYPEQVKNLKVISTDGTQLGSVHSMQLGQGQDRLVLLIEGKQVPLPFVSALVPEVNLEAGFVRVNLPEGILDL